MRTDLPQSVVATAQELTVDPLVSLYEIVLRDTTTFRLSPTRELVWQDNTYEDIPCHMSGVGQNSDGKVVRPRFSFANPGGMFTASLYEGHMDNASVTRIRVLKSDLEADRDFAIRETFRVSRVVTISNQMAVVELRDALDGHRFQLPARAFFPPEFPHVKLR